MAKKKTHKELSQKALKEADMYVLITFDGAKVGFHTDRKNGGLVLWVPWRL